MRTENANEELNAVNAEVNTDNEKETPQEAPVKRDELEIMLEKQAQMDEAMRAIFENLSKEGYEGHGYDKESVVEVPGRLFATLSNYHNTIATNMAVLQRSLMPINKIAEATITGASEIQLEFMKIHQKNCFAGITSSPAELEEEEAKDQIKVETDEQAADIESALGESTEDVAE